MYNWGVWGNIYNLHIHFFLLHDPRGPFPDAFLHMFKLCVHPHVHSVTRILGVLKGLKCLQQNKLSFARLPEALRSVVWHCCPVMLTQGQNEQLVSEAQEPLPYRNHIVFLFRECSWQNQGCHPFHRFNEAMQRGKLGARIQLLQPEWTIWY